MKNSLSAKGLSMSEAQSISNICFQKANEVQNKINVINNFERSVKHLGETYIETEGVKMPDNIVDLITSKAKYHATQAFLMENIKAKDAKLNSLRNEPFVYDVPSPEMATLEVAKMEAEVGEDWAWEQLTLDETNEFILEETKAAHIGQFIHNNSKLDRLRKELPTIKKLEWMELEAGKKSPVIIETHHTSQELTDLYEKFSALHRDAESRVNYFKAKMKNLITTENARIAKDNSTELTRVKDINTSLREDYTSASAKWRDGYAVALKNFEADRNLKIQETASLKIATAPQFQETVDEILQTLKRDK